jgi:hypothetical protein
MQYAAECPNCESLTMGVFLKRNIHMRKMDPIITTTDAKNFTTEAATVISGTLPHLMPSYGSGREKLEEGTHVWLASLLESQVYSTERIPPEHSETE